MLVIVGLSKEDGKGRHTLIGSTGTEERISCVIRGPDDSEIPGAALTSEMGQM